MTCLTKRFSDAQYRFLPSVSTTRTSARSRAFDSSFFYTFRGCKDISGRGGTQKAHSSRTRSADRPHFNCTNNFICINKSIINWVRAKKTHFVHSHYNSSLPIERKKWFLWLNSTFLEMIWNNWKLGGWLECLIRFMPAGRRKSMAKARWQ